MAIRSDVTIRLNETGLVTEETFDRIEQYKSAVDWMNTFKFQLARAMKANGIKKWETDYYDFTLIPDGVTTSLDKDRMKEESVWIVNNETGEMEETNALDYYERFKKESPRKGYIKIREKE